MDVANLNTMQASLNKNIEKYKKQDAKINDLKKKLEANKLNTKNDSQIDEEVMETCEDFASLFINTMLKEMRSTLNKEEDPLYGGFAEDTFTDMLYEEYSKDMAKNGLQSFSRMIYDSMKNFS